MCYSFLKIVYVLYAPFVGIIISVQRKFSTFVVLKLTVKLSTIIDEILRRFVLLYTWPDTNIIIENVIECFAKRENRRLEFIFELWSLKMKM